MLILLLKAYLAGGPPWPVLPLVLASWTPQFALEKHLVSHFFIEETVRTGRSGRGEDALVEVRRSSSLLRNADPFIKLSAGQLDSTVTIKQAWKAHFTMVVLRWL